MWSSLKRWVGEHNLVLIFIGIYFLFSIIKIEHPGVNNDQLMFVNTATFNPDNMFLWKSWHGIPVMVFPYIGALKSYLYMPIFYLFGVNIWSIRLPQIIIISISWFILYKTLIIAFNKKLALTTVLFLCIDPSLIAYSKIDQGPTVLEFFFKILAVYFLYLYLSTKKGIFFFSIFPTLALGIFNKLNFIWFINAFVFSLLIFYSKNLYQDFKKVNKLFPFLIIGLSYFFLIRIFLKISREVSLSYKDFTDPVAVSNVFKILLIFFNNLVNIINGNMLFKIVYGYIPTPFGNYFSTLIILILFIGSYYLIKNHSSKPYYFFLAVIISMILQLLLTRQAISAWHVLSIYPFFTIIFAGAVLEIYSLLKTQRLRNIFIFVIGMIVFCQIIINIIYLNQYSQSTKSVAYSAKIYDLINFVKERKEKIICLDVDICNQLLSFNQQTGKYKEPFFFLDPPTYNYSFYKLADNFKNPDQFLYVDHSEVTSHFPNFRKSFFQYLNANKINYAKVKDFSDGENSAFEIYKIGHY
ncbi:MAG: glycosyltransferase family 39 protein [bacterium]|nr:glycosyltransferase family 39 protein [bacterium]